MRDDESPSLDIESVDEFEPLLAASIHHRIAIGPHTGRKALTLHTISFNPPTGNPCIAQLSGFSLIPAPGAKPTSVTPLRVAHWRKRTPRLLLTR